MQKLGRKRQKKLAEGAGLLLSLLREGNTSHTIPCSSEADSDAEEVEVNIPHGFELECRTGDREKSGGGSESVPPSDSEIIADARVVIEGLLEALRESCSPSPENADIEKPPSFHYVDYQFDGGKVEQILCEKSPFSVRSHNFIKGCKWQAKKRSPLHGWYLCKFSERSPDGIHLMVSSDDCRLRIFSLPDHFYTKDLKNIGSDNLNQVNIFNAGEPVYDFCWYPYISYPNEHCTLLAYTSADHPIHLRDIYGQEIVATYFQKNHLDERTNAFSLCFSLDGRHLYAGFKDCIRVFDFLRPGIQLLTKSTKGDKRLFNGQTGIISCISMNPTYSGLYACGSYNRTIGIYADELKNPQFVLQGPVGGVTHLIYSPDGNCIFSGGRKDNDILCWDMRQLGSVLCGFERKVDTNQRIYFDVDKNGKYLMNGNTDGNVKIWNIRCPTEKIQFRAHQDCANSVSFNPFLPWIANGNGQRKTDSHLYKYLEDEEDDPTSSISCSDSDEICIKLWRVGN